MRPPVEVRENKKNKFFEGGGEGPGFYTTCLLSRFSDGQKNVANARPSNCAPTPNF